MSLIYNNTWKIAFLHLLTLKNDVKYPKISSKLYP